MKKFTILFATILVALGAVAEKGTIILTSPLNFQVLAVSPNGKWACGISGDGITSTEKGALWNLETGEFIYLSSQGGSTAYDVADDGTVVGSGGYYKNGVWNRFDNSTIPGVGGGTVFSISRDGRTAVGYVSKGGDMAPCKWVDGKLSVIYPYDNGVAQCYTVSDDGQYAAGWGYTTIGGSTLNRTIALWTDSTVQYLSPRATFAEAGRRFSPDNSKLVCESYGHKLVYDLNTQEKFELPFISYDCINQLVCYVNNDGLVLGGEEMFDNLTGASDMYGYVWTGEKTMKMDQWLKEVHNVDIDPAQHKIYRGVEMSNDGNVIAMLSYPYIDGMLTGDYVSLIVLLDREIDYCPPVTLVAEKLRGVNRVRLTWNTPISNAENVVGYNVYRDGVLVSEGLSDMAYIDAVPAEGEYTYTVTALYEGEDDEFIESEHSEPISINVVAEPANPARNIQTHAVNYNDMKLRWEAPESNLPALTYFDYNANAAGFGGGLISFSAAIRVPNDIVDNYANNHAIARVAFMPRNAEGRYTIKVYVNGVEKVSQPVDNDILTFNSMNTIDLESPLMVATGDNVLVAIDVDASQFTASSNDVLGVSYGNVVTGYSDLLRQLVEPEYYSLNQSSIDSGYGEMPVCWAISAIFAPIDANGKPNVECDILEGYDLYRDDSLLASLTDAAYLDQNIPTGRHEYSIVARFADGTQASPATRTINFAPKTEALPAIADVRVVADVDFVEAVWDAPIKNDATVISYATGRNSGKGITQSGASGLIEYTVAHEYPFSYVEWYEGYNIEALRFYPTDEAIFAVALEVNGVDHEMIVLGEMGEPDGYTLNTWNTIKLTEPYKIKEGNTIRVKLVCSEVDPSTYPICMSTDGGSSSYSDLYSWDYSRYSSAYVDGGLSGSWMLGMVVANDNTEPIPVKGYNVVIDGETANDQLITATNYRKDNMTLTDGSTHRLRVNAVYDVAENVEVEGQQVYFDIHAGVESVEVDRINVYPNPATSFVAVEGNCDRLVLVDMAGRNIAETSNNVLNVTSIPVGNYLLNIHRNDNVECVKILIVR